MSRPALTLLSCWLLALSAVRLCAQPASEVPLPGDSLTVAQLRQALRPHPRLILDTADLGELTRLPHYAFLRKRADALLAEPPLTRKLVGRRLLSVSREALRRTTTLALVYRASGERVYLERLERELLAVCAFADWNPSHYLDVAEMATAVALGFDWTYDFLSASTRARVSEVLYEKAVLPALGDHDWVTTDNNWNQVCHAGSVAAALAVADAHPAEAVRVVNRALRNAHFALDPYAPHGVYPEGPSYWAYGTGFSVMQIEVLRSALGEDFGLTQYPGFLASATWLALAEAPSGMTHNFGDCSERLGGSSAELRAWFAAETRNAALVDSTAVLDSYASGERGSRMAALALLWVARYLQTEGYEALPKRWVGMGPSPVAYVQQVGERGYYLAVKGGRGSINHGNLDAGSFVFEVDGVRWGIDPGNQSYHPLEAAGVDLWNRDQHSQRWSLLSKSNFGHSTLSVDDALHRVAGFAALRQDTLSGVISVSLDSVFEGQLAGARRTYAPLGEAGLLVTDSLVVLPGTRTVRWQMMTTATVEVESDGAILSADGKQLALRVLAPAGATLAVVSLDPPPLPLDIEITGLKRVDVLVPAALAREGRLEIVVALEGLGGAGGGEPERR